MNNNRANNKAIVMGLFETGLGVVRSLGQKGIDVTGIDFHKNIGFYSKYIKKPKICPHPVENESSFIDFLINKAGNKDNKSLIFIDSDLFLGAISKNRITLSEYFLFNLPEIDLLNKITNKYEQFKLALDAGVNVPGSKIVSSNEDISGLKILNFPLFIKAVDVTVWRKKISGTLKGFVVKNNEELESKVNLLLNADVSFLVQEIIEGPDTNHYKYCAYYDRNSQPLAEFTLQKIRQNPVHFGVGSVVQSINNYDLLEAGRTLFRNIKYTGIGSAEFKLDNRDGQLKLIELNPRYWQQNYLSTACGVNFPWVNYLDLTTGFDEKLPEFAYNIKWVNRYMDFDSFLKYRKEGTLTFRSWRNSLKGKKVYSDFMWEDPVPLMYEFGFGYKLLKAPVFLFKKFVR